MQIDENNDYKIIYFTLHLVYSSRRYGNGPLQLIIIDY